MEYVNSENWELPSKRVGRNLKKENLEPFLERTNGIEINDRIRSHNKNKITYLML